MNSERSSQKEAAKTEMGKMEDLLAQMAQVDSQIPIET